MEGFGWRGPQKDSNQGNQERGPFFLLVIAAAGADVTPEEVAVLLLYVAIPLTSPTLS